MASRPLPLPALVYSTILATTPAPTVRPALADGEAQALVHRDRRNQVDLHRHVVARHHHLRPVRQLDRPRNVRRPEIELRTVVREKRRVTPALVLRQDVRLRLETRVRRDRARLRQHLAALHLVALRPTKQNAHVVARLALIQQLPEHLDARAHRLRRLADADDAHVVANLHNAALDPPRHNRPAARNREHVLDRHQERLVLRALGLRHVVVNRRHQLKNRLTARRSVATLQRRKRRATDHRNVVPRELVRRQQLPNLKLHQVQKLLVVNHVHLVHVDDQRGNAHLARKQNVLPRLRHRSVRRRDHQDRAVHLRRPRDHVLHVVRMARAVHVRVMATRRLVLDVRRRDRDPALALLRRLVDLVERHELRAAHLAQHARDRRRQRRLPVVNVTDRADVAVRLRTLKLRLRHRYSLSGGSGGGYAFRRNGRGLRPTPPGAPDRSDRTP